MITVCCVCGKILKDDHIDDRMVSHGYCVECVKKTHPEISQKTIKAIQKASIKASEAEKALREFSTVGKKIKHKHINFNKGNKM
jgi:endonuclease V-like protein UPF0215 family